MNTSRLVRALPAALAVAALIAPTSAAVAATPAAGGFQPAATQAAPAPTTEGIIMRDGGICNPRWGC